MRIGIDARLIHETGVGRYIRNLIRELAILDDKNEYVIFLRKKEYQAFRIPNSRWTKCIADVTWHSIREQLVMPWVFFVSRLDIVHIPYFNVPIFYFGKCIVTIHDLTILHFDTGKASTLPYWMYKIRRTGYRTVLSLGVKKATRIIAVSNTVKNDIVRNLGVHPDKISVTYEGVDPIFYQTKRNGPPASRIQGKYFLYVGNVYPHKNIEFLLEAYRQYRKLAKEPASLVFVGPHDYFYKKLEAMIPSLGLEGCITFHHTLTDAQLYTAYEHAIALLFPSVMEGFGLPAVEALALGCRVICSDIPVFREILGNLPTYIHPDSIKDFSSAMVRISGEPHDAKEYRKTTIPSLKKYSWVLMTQKTRSLYETA
jgi:glycosyltransferase involved in cell wall biosynthesis